MLKIFVFFLTSLGSMALSQEKYTLSVNDRNITFYQYDEMNILSNKQCDLFKKKKLCKDFLFLKNLSLKDASDSSGGIAPGSIACTNVLKGKITIAITKNGLSQISICQLNSLMIDVGTLTYYVKK